MARTSTVIPAISRDSRTADQPRSASHSKFRSAKYANRVVEARAMIGKRQAEMGQLEKALERAESPKVRKMLTQRLLATKNNLRSWEAYISGHNEKHEPAYREPRAVIQSK